MRRPEDVNKPEVAVDIATEEIIEAHNEQQCANGSEDNEGSLLDKTYDEKEVTSSQVHFDII